MGHRRLAPGAKTHHKKLGVGGVGHQAAAGQVGRAGGRPRVHGQHVPLLQSERRLRSPTRPISTATRAWATARSARATCSRRRPRCTGWTGATGTRVYRETWTLVRAEAGSARSRARAGPRRRRPRGRRSRPSARCRPRRGGTTAPGPSTAVRGPGRCPGWFYQCPVGAGAGHHRPRRPKCGRTVLPGGPGTRTPAASASRMRGTAGRVAWSDARAESGRTTSGPWRCVPGNGEKAPARPMPAAAPPVAGAGRRP